VHDEKKEFALKTDHDREDLIELPHFINFPSDQGLIADEEMTENVNIESVKETEKASASTTLSQAALEQVEIHGVQSGVSLIDQNEKGRDTTTLNLCHLSH
jgi:hypothetical protein